VLWRVTVSESYGLVLESLGDYLFLPLQHSPRLHVRVFLNKSLELLETYVMMLVIVMVMVMVMVMVDISPVASSCGLSLYSRLWC
jgi:hypothetical protein